MAAGNKCVKIGVSGRKAVAITWICSGWGS